MKSELSRRDLLRAAQTATSVLAARPVVTAQQPPNSGKTKLSAFDYDGVRLRESRWQKQYQAAREYYLAVPDDDILHGFRAAAGLPAPGQPLGGWCARDSSTVFGQWLSGMSRMYRATGDTAIRDKAVYLMTEWGKTIAPNGDCRMRHYPCEKLVCGLVDMQKYAGQRNAIELLEKVTAWSSANLNRDRISAVL